MALESRFGHAYNEEAFRHFLAIERKRGGRSRSSTLVVLIDVNQQPGIHGGIPAMVAARIFSVLWHSVREVDVIGWFRENRVAGALLTQGADPPTPEVRRRIAQRITETLSARVPGSVARQLHVRVLRLRPGQKS